MRHRKTKTISSIPHAQRKALTRALVRSLLIYEQIKTTGKKAKIASIYTEKIITLAKKNDLHSKRLAFAFLQDHKLVKRLFEDIGPRFSKKTGGYTRVIKAGPRKGDGADLNFVELTVRKENIRLKKAAKVKSTQETSVQKQPAAKQPSAEDQASKKGLRQSLRKIFKKEHDTR